MCIQFAGYEIHPLPSLPANVAWFVSDEDMAQAVVLDSWNFDCALEHAARSKEVYFNPEVIRRIVAGERIVSQEFSGFPATFA